MRNEKDLNEPSAAAIENQRLEEWDAYRQALMDIREQIYIKLQTLDPKVRSDYYRRMRTKHQELFTSVPDPQQYLAYHVSLSGSGSPGDSPKLDFPGEQSLLQFYKQLLQELEG